MILQALVDYYEALAEKGKIARPGWAEVRVSFALELTENGGLLQVHPLKSDQGDGKKPQPRPMTLPAPVKRTVGVAPNFLCDNSAYFLGFDGKGKPERAKDCFSAAKDLHIALLDKLEDPFARAICCFFKSWETEAASEHPKITPYKEDIEKGANLVFLFRRTYPDANRALAQAWQGHYDSGGETEGLMRCLVTGKEVAPAPTHPAVKGVKDAQSSGAALVSFNTLAACSYEREQNLNAPVGKYAAFAYTTALNQLLSNKEHVKRIGDTTLIYWAEQAESAYQEAFSGILDGGDGNKMTNEDLDSFMKAIVRGSSANWEGIPVNPENRFFILGLSPNAARLSVRFFLCSTFGSFVQNIQRHYACLDIVSDGRSRWKNGRIPLWLLLRETINENSNDKSASPQMSGDTLRAILTGCPYPATLYQQTQLRIRAERKITQGRAAILKAYLLRNTNQDDYKEALQVELNDSTSYQPYVLGRLFSVAEAIQETASGVTSIKDKYFSSACSSPALVFPLVLNLVDKHLRKLEGGMKTYYAKQLGELMEKISESYPVHHSLYDQGIFQLGYYHQTQKRFEKRDKTDATVCSGENKEEK